MSTKQLQMLTEAMLEYKHALTELELDLTKEQNAGEFENMAISDVSITILKHVCKTLEDILHEHM